MQVERLHDNADGAGDGQFIGHDELARGSHIIAAAGGETFHAGDDGFFSFVLKHLNGFGDLVRSHHFAARRINAQDDGLDSVIGRGEVELFLDARGHVVANRQVAADHAPHIHYGDAVLHVSIAHGHFRVGGSVGHGKRVAYGIEKPRGEDESTGHEEKEEQEHVPCRAVALGGRTDLRAHLLGRQDRRRRLVVGLFHGRKIPLDASPSKPLPAPICPLTVSSRGPILVRTGRFGLGSPARTSRFNTGFFVPRMG